MDDIEQRFRREVSCIASSDSLVRDLGVFFVDLDGLLASRAGSSLGHQLSLTALVHADEPEDGFVDSLSDSKETMVLEQSSFVVTDALGNVLAFLSCQYDPIEILVQDVVVVESARVLGQSVQLAAECAE